jgi:hypothetical protein
MKIFAFSLEWLEKCQLWNFFPKLTKTTSFSKFMTSISSLNWWNSYPILNIVNFQCKFLVKVNTTIHYSLLHCIQICCYKYNLKIAPKSNKKMNKTIKSDIKTTTIFEIISCTNHILWMKWKQSHISVRVVWEQRDLHPLRTKWSQSEARDHNDLAKHSFHW